MKVILSEENQWDFHYELECILRMFRPQDRVEFSQNPDGEGDRVLVETWAEGNSRSSRVSLFLGSFSGVLEETSLPDRRETELSICRLLYRLLSQATGRAIQWGILTGIRPVKMVREMRGRGMTPEEIAQVLSEKYLVAPEKTDLCLLTDQVQQPVIAKALPHGYSLYVSIPFCPSRCSYCSFVSHSIEKTRRLIPEYLEKLQEELTYAGRIAKEMGLVLQSIYMGGGTPTVLEAEQLARLLDVINQSFDRSRCVEFTVEAGRPDTITREKLAALIGGGVDRISVNPQTLNDQVLRAVGRKHTAEQFFQAFECAKSFAFTAVNVDLIAGLPGDTVDSFHTTLDRIIDLEPENITVHSLTMKRAADMIGEKNLHLNGFSPAGEMVNYSQKALAAKGYLPYYLYRQKSTVDSLENVGFSKGNTPCFYNVFIMDETHTILSAGGGGVTKVVLPGNRIERIFNYKYPYEYISRFQNILERKDAFKALGLSNEISG
jgi:oxygen-independent coproporphyrinogen-3 oxidase